MNKQEIPSPLAPLAELSFANGPPGVQASIKTEFSDFRVDEDLGFEPTGSGEHLYLQVKKTDLTTIQTARRLAETAGLPLRDIGYSGMKDRRGETTQWFSLRLAPDRGTRLGSVENDNLQILKSARNQRKLKIGSHRCNHFRLLLRDCRGPGEEFERRLMAIARAGVPNYFGAQRFGRDMSNIHKVLKLMRQKQPQRAPRDGRQRRGMLYSAARAYLFNQVLSKRLAAGNWCAYLEGDVLNLDATGRFFTVAAANWDASLQNRLETFDIHITGPLAGIRQATDKYNSRAEAAALEEAVLSNYRELQTGLEAQGLRSSRRPLRFVAQALRWQWQADTENTDQAGEETLNRAQGANLAVSFSLPRGAYATSLLREICETVQAE